MNGLLVLLLAVSVSEDGPRKVVIQEESGRVQLTAAADDGTMNEVPDSARILFMLSAGNISPDGLKQLARLRQVEFLRLDRSAHGDAALKALDGHPSLRTLKLWKDTGVTADGIRHLSSVPSLRSLDFTDVPLDKAALYAMPKHVESLTISRCQIGDAGLAALPTFLNLKGIALKYDDGITDAGLIAFLERHRGLEGLAVDVASDRLLASLERLPNLRTLWLAGSPITATGLPSIGRLTKLERLDISSEVSDDLRARLRRLPNPKLDFVVHQGKYIYLDRDRPRGPATD